MRALVTGSAGLIGSECVKYLAAEKWDIVGIDNDFRGALFGDAASTHDAAQWLTRHIDRYIHIHADIRDRQGVRDIVREHKPDLIIHAAGQPAHDTASRIPYDDFDVNAVGTLNLLVAARDFCRESPFCFMSTNKVYGDRPNSIPTVEDATRFRYLPPITGVSEQMPVDQCLHSLFGASKLSADILCQEYGRYFQMPIGIFRASCVTGATHAAVEQHGFLAYIVRAALRRIPYTVFGFKGKQVRDQLHASDLARLFLLFYAKPHCGEVFNVGGGDGNSISILEVGDYLRCRGLSLQSTLVDTPRVGDHRCYITDLSKIRRTFPEWVPSRSPFDLINEMLVHNAREHAVSARK